MKKLLFIILLMAALSMGINPADWDPFFDNPHDTYSLLAQTIPLPQTWERPERGPNADQCQDVFDKGIPCSVDGQLYGYFGEVQPNYCDNNHFLPDGRTLKPEATKCHCNIAMMTDDSKCPMNSTGEFTKQIIEGNTCLVYCRETDNNSPDGHSHCHCIDICDALNTESYKEDTLVKKPAPKTAKKPATKKK